MSSRDEWPENPNDNSPQQADQWRENSGRGCLKFVLILGTLGFLTIIVCCGGFAWLVWGFLPRAATTPSEVAEVGQKIMKFELPPDFIGESAATVDNPLLATRFATFRHKDGKGTLRLGALWVKLADFTKQRVDFRVDAEKHFDDEHKLDVKRTIDRDFTIRGKKVAFKFSEAEELGTGKKFRVVTGEFESPASLTILELILEDDAYDEAAVIKIIESIQ